MTIDFRRVKERLQRFEFQEVFREDLGWSSPARGLRPSTFVAAGVELERKPIAELGGFVVFEVTAADGKVPDAKVRAAAHKVVGGHHHEHVLIFLNSRVKSERRQSVWSWIHRRDGRDHPRTHYYFQGQPGDLFIGKLGALMFDLGDFDEEGNVSVVEVARRVRAALDVERVTKSFFEEFQKQHDDFLELVRGISDERQRRWYVSVLFNRLMFIYFLQKKGFLDTGNLDYLQKLLQRSQGELGPDRFYNDYLKPLFFEGFAKPVDKRSPEARLRLGSIRYLNGGLFLPHRIELDNPEIDIPDRAFEALFALFGRYTWHLDDTPGGDDSEINPDVLGYIFEKYINQKSFGAYYTRPEITDWLCEQTIHRHVLERVNVPEGMDASWLGAEPARFESVSDLLLHLTPALCRQLLDDVLPKLTVLDPACGSGAFLVAALKEMRSLYGAVVGAAKTLPDQDLKDRLKRWEADHPSLGYFLKKRIITDNLYGVDLMEEATEIARLRLFLALVASAAREEDLEPLPNIDFNIMPGNSLVGLLRVNDEAYDRGSGQLDLGFRKVTYREAVAEKNRLIDIYRHMSGYTDDLGKVREDIEKQKAAARAPIDQQLLDYFKRLDIRFEEPTWDSTKNDLGKSKKRPLGLDDIKAQRPFHWGYEFDEVMEQKGGFDVILANPPWEVFKPNAKEFFQEYSDVISKNNMRIEDFEKEQKKLLKKPDVRRAWLAYLARFPHMNDYFRKAQQYAHQSSVVAGKRTGTDINLYKLFVEQCLNLLRPGGQLGLVVPGSFYADMGAKKLREVLLDQNTVHALFGISNERKLFEGVDHRVKLCLLVATKGGTTACFDAAFRINPREAVGADGLAEFLRDRREHIELTPALVRKTSPESLSVMEFRTAADVATVDKMLKEPLLGDHLPGAWQIELCREFHVTDDRELFKGPGSGRLPLYEGKMIQQYEWRNSEPRYWVVEEEAERALRPARARRAQQAAAQYGIKIDDAALARLSLEKDAYRLAFRQVTRNTDMRSMICTVLPPRVVANDTLVLHRAFADEIQAERLQEVLTLSPQVMLYVLAIFNSFSVDWLLRQRISAHASMFYVYQLPVPRLTEADPRLAPIAARAAKLTCTTPEFDKLAKAVGLGSHKKGVTDPEQRAQLRAEIDGLVAHLYGLAEEEFAHILRTFPVVPEPVREAARNAYRAVARGDIT